MLPDSFCRIGAQRYFTEIQTSGHDPWSGQRSKMDVEPKMRKRNERKRCAKASLANNSS